MSLEKFLGQVKSMDEKTPIDHVMSMYDEWADTYDEDVLKTGKCVLNETVGGWLHKKLKESGYDTTVRLFDAGCGTGNTGKIMKEQYGYSNMDGLDGSPASIEKAREKDAYKNLSVGLLGLGQLTLEMKQYDALICVGCLGMGHMPATAMDEFVSLVKKGGIICFTIRKYIFDDTKEGHNFAEKMQELTANNVWESLDNMTTLGHTNVHFNAYMFKVLV